MRQLSYALLLLLLTVAAYESFPMVATAVQLNAIVQRGTTAPHLWTVLVHGLDSSSRTWAETLEAVQSFPGNFLAVDQRGCGLSPDPTDFSYDALVEDLRMAIQTHCSVADPRLVLVGHSLGARVVLGYAAKYPKEVNALVMEDMDIAVRNPKANGVVQLSDNYPSPFLRSFKTQEAALEALRDAGYPDSFVDKFVRTGRIYERPAKGDYWSDINPDFRRLCYQHVLNTTRAQSDWLELAQKHATQFPCHVLVAGPEGTVCDPASVAEMQKVWPQAHIHHFADDSGHSLHSTAPDAYQTLLRQILQQVVEETTAVDSREG